MKNFLKYIKGNDATFVDFRFTDLLGQWHHMTFCADQVDESFLEKGFCIDGSSIPGWLPINDSDMLLKADLTSPKNYVMDPFSEDPTVIVTTHVYDPETKELYSKDPRAIAKKAQDYLKESGMADQAFFGPEPEFFIFDHVAFDTDPASTFYELDSDEFPHNNQNASDMGNHGQRPKVKGGYFPVTPTDSLNELRNEISKTLIEMGVKMEKHHHEVAPAQHEIGFTFGDAIESADNLQKVKYVVKNICRNYGKTATFMPKPVFGDNGSGRHVHQSLIKDGANIFDGNSYANLSETALYYIGGILKHAKALNAFTNPCNNSYKRLVPGYEAPVIRAYCSKNRSVACRIPYSDSEKARRIEARFPDPAANGYLALSALLMAGLDGIRHKIHPGDPQAEDLFEKEDHGLETMAFSLRDALTSFEKNHDFLLHGGVFTKDLIDSYLTLKWEEVKEYENHPHPVEFKQSYNV